MINSEKLKHIDLYTDGACSGNPGPGGWGAIIVYREVERVLSGGETSTTNNRMELTGVIEALSLLKEPCEVALYSDSKYLIDALTLGWAVKWRSNNWIKSDKKLALNADLWEKLLALTEYHRITPTWVRGHNGHPYNERCDRLAVEAIEKVRNK